MSSLAYLLSALKKALPATLFLGAMSVVAVPSARAQLTLWYDTSHDKMWFTGSDTITTNGSGNIAWWNGVTGGAPFTHLFAGHTLIPNLLSSDDPVWFFTTQTIDMSQDGAPQFAFTVADGSALTAVTLTGLGYGQAWGFGDFNGAELAALESLSGTTVALFSGTGGSPLHLQSVNAIPEPSTYAALAGALVLAVSLYRRKGRQLATVATT